MRLNEKSDWDLVALVQAGELAAFSEIVARYEKPLVHFCKAMVGNQEDAEDLAQDCFIRIHRYIQRLRPRAKFSTVLFGFARNLTLNFLRDMKRRGRGKTISSDAEEERGSSVAVDNLRRPDKEARLREIESIIEAAMDKLSVEHKEVLVLREFQGMDYETIAQIVKCAKGTVKSRLARAREQLRKRVLELGGDVL